MADLLHSSRSLAADSYTARSRMASARTKRSVNSGWVSFNALPMPRYCRWLCSMSSRSCANGSSRGTSGTCSENPKSVLSWRKVPPSIACISVPDAWALSKVPRSLSNVWAYIFLTPSLKPRRCSICVNSDNSLLSALVPSCSKISRSSFR